MNNSQVEDTMFNMNTQEAPKPLKIITPNLAPEIVGKYYLKAEFSKLFTDSSVRESLDNRIDALTEQEFWRLLEAMSFSYRLNGMFWFISDESYEWSEEEWLIGDLTLTGMHPHIDQVIFSAEIQQDPIKFRDHLQRYFIEHPDDDPLGLDQFRPSDRTINYPIITVRENEGKILLLDGSNRFIANLLQGEEKVRAYVGRQVREGKQRIGDSTFWLLLRLWRNASTEDRSAIETVTRLLISQSSDGESAVRSYWVDHATEEELKEVGRKLLQGS